VATSTAGLRDRLEQRFRHWRYRPPYRTSASLLALALVLVLVLTWLQFRGAFEPKVQLTVLSGRAGLSMDPGSKVTYNGVPIGRLTTVDVVTVDDNPEAKLTLDVDPKYIRLIPENVDVELRATTVFGNKYVSFVAPKNPASKRLSAATELRATGVTTEFNTLFETITAISEQVDPIKLNQTLTAAAQGLDGLGDKFGGSIVNGNDILADLNARMPRIHRDIRGLADLSDVYANSSQDLWDGLTNAVTTARTLNAQRGNLDKALVAAVGFGNTGGDIFERGGPYLVRGNQDLLPVGAMLDRNSPSFFCMIRNHAEAAPAFAQQTRNGYSFLLHDSFVGAGNAYVYPDNLPRVNATGGPEGRPGCWQPITRDLWPAPYLVMDTGASIAPYNHFELGQPLTAEYIWGRQIGERTINP
jgi:phospholipid/cholesterol/gamma-HCH transport system substrate-binding protein